MENIKDYFILKNAHTAKSIIWVFKEGSSLPVICESYVGNKYFTKLKGSGEGVRALVADYVSVKLATHIGLPVGNPVFIYINKNTKINIKNDEVYELVRNSYGINLCFEFHENARIYDEKYDSKFFTEEIKQLIYLYDSFLMNVDRTHKNPNIILAGTIGLVLDFGAAFLFKSIFDDLPYEKNQRILNQLTTNIFFEKKIKPFYT